MGIVTSKFFLSLPAAFPGGLSVPSYRLVTVDDRDAPHICEFAAEGEDLDSGAGRDSSQSLM